MESKLLIEEILQLLSEGYSVTIRATGYSMYPFIKPNRDKVVLYTPKTVKIGDIVLALTKSKGYVLHRVYKIDGDIIQLMGDGNLSEKEVCKMCNILGKVIKIIRQGHEIDCYSSKERFLSKIWMSLLPIRKWLLFICCYQLK